MVVFIRSWIRGYGAGGHGWWTISGARVWNGNVSGWNGKPGDEPARPTGTSSAEDGTRPAGQIDENLVRSQARLDAREKRLAEDDDKPTIH